MIIYMIKSIKSEHNLFLYLLLDTERQKGYVPTIFDTPGNRIIVISLQRAITTHH